MAKIRSPNYPVMDLGAAMKAARKAFDKDNRNKMNKGALAKHLGHDSLSGPALGKIGALRAYGLIDGAGDELRITDDAVHAMMAPEGSSERSTAMLKLATQPKLFQDIRKDFPTLPSADNLKFWLVKRQFASDAAEKAAKTYLATMRLVEGGTQAYDSSENTPDEEGRLAMETERPRVQPGTGAQHIIHSTPDTFSGKAHQEIFNLDEGAVVLTYPSFLSAQSYQDLSDYLELFLRKAKRRAERGDDEAAN